MTEPSSSARGCLRAWTRPLARSPWFSAAVTEITYRLGRRLVARRLSARRHLPRALHVEGTNICNAACVFCAYPQMERRKSTLPMADFERVVDEYVAMGGRHVSLTPIVGDPFVDRFLFERLDYLARIPAIASFHLFTNAILMTPETGARLIGYGARLTLGISLGGVDAETCG